MRCKRDILYILIGILFGYYHGIIRIWALVTAYDISWGSRDLKAAGQPASAAEPEVARHKESTAPAAGLGLDATRKEDLTEASAIVPAVPSPELLDVLAKYQRPIHPHESVWATSYAVGLLDRPCDPLHPSPEVAHRRMRRFTIAV